MNNAGTNMYRFLCEQYIFIYPGKIPRNKLMGHMTNVCLTLEKIVILFPGVAELFCIPTSHMKIFQLLHILPAFNIDIKKHLKPFQ